MDYSPDFIERNGTWVLSMFGAATACVSSLLVYCLKSRCTKIKCCGCELARDTIELRAARADLEPV